MTSLSRDMVIGLLLIAAGACSIGVTGWQYAEEGFADSTTINGSSLCKSAFFEFNRRKYTL
ncbi:hypothetical protein EON64_13160 [archaeon]|nr:MAG: hypothetical protein EON64_13160 [archaeon]